MLVQLMIIWDPSDLAGLGGSLPPASPFPSMWIWHIGGISLTGQIYFKNYSCERCVFGFGEGMLLTFAHFSMVC